VFEEFRQVGEPTRRHGGSGLGLAVCRRFVELHQGTIWVQSTLGQGSTFYLRLPIDDSAAPAGSVGWSWEDRIAARVRGQSERRVLVVDESEEIARVFRRYLDGYRVLTTADLRLPGEERGGKYQENRDSERGEGGT